MTTRANSQLNRYDRVSGTHKVEATTGAITQLGDHLAGLGIQKVTVESTSDYWRLFVRHEVPRVRAEVKGLRLRPVAAGR